MAHSCVIHQRETCAAVLQARSWRRRSGVSGVRWPPGQTKRGPSELPHGMPGSPCLPWTYAEHPRRSVGQLATFAALYAAGPGSSRSLREGGCTRVPSAAVRPWHRWDAPPAGFLSMEQTNPGGQMRCTHRSGGKGPPKGGHEPFQEPTLSGTDSHSPSGCWCPVTGGVVSCLRRVPRHRSGRTLLARKGLACVSGPCLTAL
jgi:hypothetical protein